MCLEDLIAKLGELLTEAIKLFFFLLVLKKFETSENFTRPRDKKVFELYKRVWGNNGSKEAA